MIDHPEAYICTAADDTYYPQGWLEALTKRVVEGERCVLCHRAYCIRVDADGNPRPYRRWEIETRRETADARVFLTGVGGVLYPPGCFDAEVLNEAALLSLAPRADDLWFYFMLRRNGYRCRKVPGRLRLRMWTSTSAWSVQPFSTVSGPAPRRRPQPSSKISTAVPLRPLSRARNRP